MVIRKIARLNIGQTSGINAKRNGDNHPAIFLNFLVIPLYMYHLFQLNSLLASTTINLPHF